MIFTVLIKNVILTYMLRKIYHISICLHNMRALNNNSNSLSKREFLGKSLTALFVTEKLKRDVLTKKLES